MSSRFPIEVCKVVLAVEAASAVNNMAVRLLEQNCFIEARTTFQDSLRLMKIAINPSDVAGIDISSTLQAAGVRLSQSEVNSDLQVPRMNAKSFEYGDLSALDTAFFECEPSRFQPVLLRFDDLDQRTIEDTIELYIAMILYNQGLANLLAFAAADTSTNTGSKEDLMVRNRFLKRAHACLLSARELLSYQISMGRDVFQKLNMLVILAQVINRSVQVFRWSGGIEQHHVEVKEARDTLIQICDFVRETLDDLLGINEDDCCPAAAA
jgi:hypothetical protein